MGLIYADLEILNAEDSMQFRRGKIKESEVKKTMVRALVDSGAYQMCINEDIKNQLDLSIFDTLSAELANGRIEKFDIVGPIEIRFKNRKTICNAVVLPGDSEVLLGSIPMEDMDVVLNPKEETMEVNPASPYIAKKKIK